MERFRLHAVFFAVDTTIKSMEMQAYSCFFLSENFLSLSPNTENDFSFRKYHDDYDDTLPLLVVVISQKISPSVSVAQIDLCSSTLRATDPHAAHAF
jgi:hypothetical protein